MPQNNHRGIGLATKIHCHGLFKRGIAPPLFIMSYIALPNTLAGSAGKTFEEINEMRCDLFKLA